MIDDWRINFEERSLPPEVWDFLRDKKFFRMIIPQQHGGLGFSAAAHSEVVSERGANDLHRRLRDFEQKHGERFAPSEHWQKVFGIS